MRSFARSTDNQLGENKVTKEWKLTNGDFDIPLCDTCAQPIYSGHVDCTCPTNHPDDCKRPTYDALTASHASLVAALEAIKRDYGKVCPQFTICTHTACQSSYGAWSIADEALRQLAAGEPGERVCGYGDENACGMIASHFVHFEEYGDFWHPFQPTTPSDGAAVTHCDVPFSYEDGVCEFDGRDNCHIHSKRAKGSNPTTWVPGKRMKPADDGAAAKEESR